MTNQWPLLNNTATATQSGPVIEGPITEDQRDRAERMLHQALRDGRLTTWDFEERFTKAMNASRISQLHAAIGNIPAVSQAVVQVRQQYRDQFAQPARPVPSAIQVDTNGVAALTHLSGLFTWILGPALFYVGARPGSPMRREAAKAFNWQLLSGLLFITCAIVTSILGLGDLMVLGWLGWVALTIIGGVQAGRGNDWANPVNKITKLNVLPTDGR